MTNPNDFYKYTIQIYKEKKAEQLPILLLFLSFVFYLLNFNHLDFNQPQEFLNCLIKD